MNAVEVKNLKKNYVSGKLFSKNIIPALKGVSFDVKKGEAFGILGPNGAGKSTLLNILTDLLTKDSGEIKVFGKDFFSNTEEIKKNMSLINGYASYPRKLTVYENMKIYARLYGIKDPKQRIEHLLSEVGLTDKRNQRFSQLSSGQRTRVNIVKGLIHKPKIILMDEPTIGLDPIVAKKIRSLIKSVAKDTTIIFTSHNMAEVEEICDRIALLKGGEILKIAPVKELVKMIDVKSYKIKFDGNKDWMENIITKHGGREIRFTRRSIIFKTGNDFGLDSLITELVERKIKVMEVSVRKPSLEHVFIEIAEGRL